ncbi:MAG: hypothetical protein ACLP59_18005 [Bryobacteraceae bacterium]
MTRRLPVLTLALAAVAGAAFGADAEFDRIVKAIETHYGTKPLHIPFMGAANLFVSVAHPGGAHSVRLAVFEDLKDLRSREGAYDWRDRDRLMDTISGPSLHPMIRVHSRHDGEATYIFMDPESKSARLLIATFERDEATVIEVRANIDELWKALEDPEHAGHTLGGERRGDE